MGRARTRRRSGRGTRPLRILFCITGVGRGHAARCRPLIAALSARGHECTAAVLGRRAGRLLEDTTRVLLPDEGFRARVAPTHTASPAYAVVWDYEMSLSFYQRNLADATLAISLFVREAIGRTQPDLVAVDQVAWAVPVARAHDLPVVQITHGPFQPGVSTWQRGERPVEICYPQALPAVRPALEAAGAAAVDRLDELLDGDLLLVLGPPALGTTGGAFHVDAPTILGPRDSESVRASSRPLVALMLGRAPALVVDAVSGVLAAGADAVVLEGRGLVEATERVQPLGTVDAGSVLAHVDAAIHHGGSGSIVTCLGTATPSIAIPSHGEQDFNARRLELTGAGIRLAVSDRPLEPIELGPGLTTLAHREPNAFAPRLAGALPGLLDGTRAEAAQAAKATLAALPGPEEAAEAIERVTVASPR